ncbi:hypothetical protein ACUXST_002527 [Sphingomonas sp. F9_3S_D5_B_2]
MTEASTSRAYRTGVSIAVLASLLTVWTTIVRDDGTGISWFLVIMAAVVGGFSAWFRPAGLARTAVGVAIMQALLGVATATAPSTAIMGGGSIGAILFSGLFAALWLISAVCFRAAASKDNATAY